MNVIFASVPGGEDEQSRYELNSMGKRQKKQANNRPFWYNYFIPKTWLTSYRRWVVVFFIVLVTYRTSIDGLVFFFFMAYGIAKNMEGYVKNGQPFIAGKKRKQKIKEYGYIRTLLSIISPFDLWRQKRNLVEEAAYILVGGLFFVVFLNHCYLLCVFLFDYFFPQESFSLFTKIENFSWPILSHWPAFIHNRINYVTHGYGDKEYLLAQTFLCALVGYIAFAFYMLYVFFTRKDIVKSVHTFMQHNIKTMWGKRKELDLYDRFFVFFFLNKYCIMLTAFSISIGLILLLHYLWRLPLHFPGELYPHKKYSWLYCYAYRDYLGYFSYSYVAYFMYLSMLAMFGGGLSCLAKNYIKIKSFFDENGEKNE